MARNAANGPTVLLKMKLRQGLSDRLAHVSTQRATVVRSKSDTYAFPKHHPFDMCHIDMYYCIKTTVGYVPYIRM